MWKGIIAAVILVFLLCLAEGRRELRFFKITRYTLHLKNWTVRKRSFYWQIFIINPTENITAGCWMQYGKKSRI